MTVELRKLRLIEFIKMIQDEALLAKHEEIMRLARIKEYEDSLKPMTAKELEQEVLEAMKDYKAGRFIELEEYQRQTENW